MPRSFVTIVLRFFTDDFSLETTVHNHTRMTFSISNNTHLSSHRISNCSCCETTHLAHAELNMPVGGSCQVPGRLFSLFNHSSEYGMRQTGSCIGFPINKTWGALIQMKGILISSSGPLCLFCLNVSTKPGPICRGEVRAGWWRRWWWWGGSLVGGQRRSPGRRPFMLEQHVRLVQQQQPKKGDEGRRGEPPAGSRDWQGSSRGASLHRTTTQLSTNRLQNDTCAIHVSCIYNIYPSILFSHGNSM